MKDNNMSIKEFVISAYIIVILMFTIGEISELQKLTFIDIIYSLLTAIMVTVPFTIIGIIIHIAIKYGRKKALKESLSEIDFKKNKGYYRDILKKYTPVELSYIDKFEINITKSIIATLLNLQLKNKIEIKNNIINVINKDITNLLETEIYVLDSIKNGEVIISNPHEIEHCAKKEAIVHKLITKNIENKKEKAKPLINWIVIIWAVFWIFIFIICIFNKFFVNFYNNVSSIIISNINLFIIIINTFIVLMIVVIGIVFFRFISKHYYLDSKDKSYKRTKLGEELNEKIEGLKNYLKNFSSLDEKEKEELTLWEEYLIYSVIFEQNNKIVEELKPLIKIDK